MNNSRRVKANHPVYTTHALEVVLAQFLQTDLLQEIILPALDTAIHANGHETLLADNTAKAAGLVASGHVGEGVGQVIELALVEQLLGHVVLKPEDLGDLHLNGHLAANIAEEVVLGVVNLDSLIDGTVVKPQNDVAVIAIAVVEVGPGDAHRLVSLGIEDGERAGGVETDTAHSAGVDVVLVQSATNGRANAPPDVGGGLLLQTCVSRCVIEACGGGRLT